MANSSFLLLPWGTLIPFLSAHSLISVLLSIKYSLHQYDSEVLRESDQESRSASLNDWTAEAADFDADAC